MTYVDKIALQEGFLSEKNISPREMMASVDKNRACYFLVEEAEKNSPHLDVLAQEIMTAELSMLVMAGLEEMKDD